MHFSIRHVVIGVAVVAILLGGLWGLRERSGQNVIDLYGYSAKAEKRALTHLMRVSGILKPDETLEMRFPDRSEVSALQEDVVSFVEAAQAQWTGRRVVPHEDASSNMPLFKERWQTTEPAWVAAQDTQVLRADLETLGMVEEMGPPASQYDAICILGSTFDSMKRRMDYATTLLSSGRVNARSVILLTGERPVTVGVDGSEDMLLKIAAEYGIFDLKKLMETNLLEYIYVTSEINKDLPVYVVNTPAGDLPRPTTETTVAALLALLKQHPDIQRIVFVSNQPYVRYQEAVIQEVAGSAIPDMAVVGPAASAELANYKLVAALGSEIWAKAPHILQRLGPIPNPELEKRLQLLYDPHQNPTIAQKIQGLFNAT